MTKQSTKLLLSAFRRMASIHATEKERIRRKTKSTRHPLGYRMFRGKMRIWPAERRQMSYTVELREAGKTWDEIYFQFLRERERNLRNNREISRGRLQNMFAAEMEFRQLEARKIAAQLVRWSEAGNSTLQIINAGAKKKFWNVEEISIHEIEQAINVERQLQQEEKDQNHAIHK